jgi:hypothetical protein
MNASSTAFGVLVFFAAPPEVSAIAATAGYCLPTLRVEETEGGAGERRTIGTVHGLKKLTK